MGRRIAIAAVFGAVLLAAPAAWAHSGGTNSAGCHAGSQPYHCHGGGSGGGGGGTVAPVAPRAPLDDQNCEHFATQQAAQDHFDADRTDPDNLDADDDGIACEANPTGPAPRPSAAPRPAACAAPTDLGAAANSVNRLYAAYFRRAPDADGLYFWWGRYVGGMCLTDISEFFATSAEFVGTYGSLGNPEFVRLVYVNVMGREPDAGGYNYWAGAITFGGVRRGTMMVGFSESPEFRSRSGIA